MSIKIKRNKYENRAGSAVGKKCDWTDKEYIKPLLDYIN